MSKAKLEAARELINEKRYREAKALLKTIDHPTAKLWLEKLDKIAPEKQSSRGNMFLLFLLFMLVVVLIAAVILKVTNNQEVPQKVVVVPTNAVLPSITAPSTLAPTFTPLPVKDSSTANNAFFASETQTVNIVSPTQSASTIATIFTPSATVDINANSTRNAFLATETRVFSIISITRTAAAFTPTATFAPPTPSPIPGCSADDVMTWIGLTNTLLQNMNSAGNKITDTIYEPSGPSANAANSAAQAALSILDEAMTSIQYAPYPDCIINARQYFINVINSSKQAMQAVLNGDTSGATNALESVQYWTQREENEIKNVLLPAR